MRRSERYNKAQILNIYHVLIFICGIEKISNLNRFAEFSVRVSDPDKKNFAGNLGRYFPKKFSISLWDLHRWHFKGGVKIAIFGDLS